MLGQLDEATYQIFQHAIIPDVDRTSYDRFKVHVQKRFAPKEHEQELRLNFRSLTQTSNQSFDEFYETLLKLAQKAFPGQNPDDHIRDKFFQGVNNHSIRVKLIESSVVGSSISAIILILI